MQPRKRPPTSAHAYSAAFSRRGPLQRGQQPTRAIRCRDATPASRIWPESHRKNRPAATPSCVSLASRCSGFPLPLTPIQALFVDIGTDPLTAVGLGVGQPESQGMRLPPRLQENRLLKPAARATPLGVIEAAAAMAAFFFLLSGSKWKSPGGFNGRGIPTGALCWVDLEVHPADRDPIPLPILAQREGCGSCGKRHISRAVPSRQNRGR
jgi:Cation transporting ATPase, C-terminus